MGLMLAPDDMAVGDMVAVHSSRVRPLPVPPELAHLVDVSEFPAGSAPRGVPLRVIGVSLPFVACAVVHPGGAEYGPTILDIRRVRLARLDTDYVEAIRAFAPAAPPDEGDDDDPLEGGETPQGHPAGVN